MRAEEASEVNEHPTATGAVEEYFVSATALADPLDASLGHRLCAAREHRGWTRAEVAARLKLPANLIARLESDNYEGLTQGVFLRGYLASYARLVGLPVDDATEVAAANTQAAPLIATGTISRSRYLFERYSVSATYMVLTAIMVVPAVWLATHGGLEQNLARTTLLDPPALVSAPAHDALPPPYDAMASSEAEGVQMPPPADNPSAQPIALPQPDPSPVIASMAPFATARSAAPAPDPGAALPAAASEPVGTGVHTLVLKLKQQSWVEVTAADGRKLEYAMLDAGSEHTYRSDGAISVRLGNAQGAQVTTDGNMVDLTPFQRGNVAHLKLFGDGTSGAGRVEQ